jgi:hypothetical protein
MFSNSSRLLSVGIAAALLAACGGGGSSSPDNAIMPTSPSQPQSANLSMLISDASTDDWATIGVKVLSIALVPQGGGANVTVYTAPTPAPIVNLVQLDQIAELLGNTSVPVGTYTGAVLTVSGNASDILLTAAADPEPGFAATPGATIPNSQIQVQHTQGSGTNLTVPVNVNFVSPLVVSTTQNNALDLEFDLSHPAFLIGHVPPAGGGETIWAVNFDGPVRHHPLRDLRWLVLRHMYGQETVADDTSVTITKEFPTEPPANPETATPSTVSLQILADANNGTIVYDMDAKTRTVVESFSTQMQTDFQGKQMRIAARYQENGTLVATRIWVSSSFNTVWLSPEGHVLHVDAVNDVVTVENEQGLPVRLSVDANTQFFFREPQNPAVDSNSIGMGPAFLTNKNLVRGFKVHASVVDPLGSPLVAQSIDIETADYSGAISAPGMMNFTYTHNFHTMTDNYVYALDYIADASANGTDMSGNALSGYKWWNFAFPTELNSGADAISGFVAATNGGVNFGGTVGAVPSYGVSYAMWNDPANADGWAAAASILMPSALPLGAVAKGLVNNSFTITVAGGTMPVTVAVDNVSGSATLVYQVDRTNGIVTVTPIDITTPTGMTDLTNGLAAGTPVKVYGVPEAADLKAYVLAYFTGDMPAQ